MLILVTMCVDGCRSVSVHRFEFFVFVATSFPAADVIFGASQIQFLVPLSSRILAPGVATSAVMFGWIVAKASKCLSSNSWPVLS
jgi:hypothetical protein